MNSYRLRTRYESRTAPRWTRNELVTCGRTHERLTRILESSGGYEVSTENPFHGLMPGMDPGWFQDGSRIVPGWSHNGTSVESRWRSTSPFFSSESRSLRIVISDTLRISLRRELRTEKCSLRISSIRCCRSAGSLEWLFFI